MDMVERVARIFAGSYAAAIMAPGKNLFIEDYWPNFKGEARRTLQAMREPTDDMTFEGNAVVPYDMPTVVELGITCGATLIWQAMIDDALHED